MTTGIVEAAVGALTVFVAMVVTICWRIRERFSVDHANTILNVLWSMGLLIMGYGANDLRPELGFWAAYGVVFGPLLVVTITAGVVARRLRRGKDEVPQPLWKWTQRV